MDRREFLAAAAAVTLAPNGARVRDFGYLPKKFRKIVSREIIEDLGPRVSLLYKFHQIIPHYQNGNPDCTAHAISLAVEILNSIEAKLFGKPKGGEVLTEYIHARALNGRTSGGTAVDDAVEVLKKGFPWRTKPYNFNTWTKWVASQPKLDASIGSSQRVTSWTEAANAIKNFQPVVIGSDVGFENQKRDKDGFIRPNGIWYHAWCLIGIDDRYRRPGGLLLSSHGKTWPGGPKRHNQPDGTAWVDADVIDKMVSKYGDSFAISDIQMKDQVETKFYFYSSPSCVPCQQYKPTVQKFENIEWVKEHSVSPVPQIWAVKDGHKVSALIGKKTEGELREWLKRNGYKGL